MKKTVLACGPFASTLFDAYRERYEIIQLDPPPGELDDAFKAAIAKAHGLIIGHRRVGAAELAGAQKLEVVASVSVGYDHHDLAYLNSRAIMLTKTPGVLNETTADLAFALILATARRIPELDAWTRAGGWNAPLDAAHFGCDVHGKTLGIIGLGEIGAAIARRGRFGFGMRILYSGNHPKPALEQELGARFVTKEELLRDADFVCPMVPLNATTRHLIDAAALALMKPSAILINLSRGGVVDEPALIDALENGVIRAAGLDVFAKEPLQHSRLFELANVVVVPHIGSATTDTRNAMATRALENLIEGLEGRTPMNLVNADALARR